MPNIPISCIPSAQLLSGTTRVYLTTGGRAAQSTSFTGRIGAFKVYNSVLTADQIKQNYNALAERYGRGLI
jgi:hypothetical protein